MIDLQHYVPDREVERGFDDRGVLWQCLLLGEEIGELFKAVRKHERMRTGTTSVTGSVDEELLTCSFASALSPIAWTLTLGTRCAAMRNSTRHGPGSDQPHCVRPRRTGSPHNDRRTGPRRRGPARFRFRPEDRAAIRPRMPGTLPSLTGASRTQSDRHERRIGRAVAGSQHAGRERLGLSVTRAGEHRVWLDEPEQVLRMFGS